MRSAVAPWNCRGHGESQAAALVHRTPNFNSPIQSLTVPRPFGRLYMKTTAQRPIASCGLVSAAAALLFQQLEAVEGFVVADRSVHEALLAGFLGLDGDRNDANKSGLKTRRTANALLDG